MTAFIEYSGYTAIWLLTGCVPNLQLDYVLIVNAHDVIAEFNADGNIMIFMKGILYQSHKYTRFPNTY